MKRIKTAAVLAVALVTAISLAGCAGGDDPADSKEPAGSAPPSASQQETQDSGAGGVTPSPLPVEEQVSPEEMDKYIKDDAAVLSGDVRNHINTYTTNWHNLFRETVGLVIVPRLEEGQSIDMVAEDYRNDLGLTDKDTVLAVSADTGDSILFVGAESLLIPAPVLPNLEPGESLEAEIMAKYEEINNYLMGGSTPESPDGPSEADIKVGEEIFTKAQSVIEDYGMVFYDITNLMGNQEQYPDSVILEAGNGHITFQMLKGSVDDCDNYWFWNYNQVTGPDAVYDENGKTTFVQKFDPANLYNHKSISGAVESVDEAGETMGAYFRADCIGNVCIAVRAENDSYKEYIDKVFAEFGVPENNNVVY